MPITGGVKFFNNSGCLFEDGNTIVAGVSGDPSAEYAIDRNRYSYYRSSGSDDTTAETLTITLASAQTIDRILILDHNWKDFSIKYDSATDFTNVVGLDGALGGGIAETAFADDTAYYEFSSVSVTSTIEITATKTQVADEEKYVNQIIISTELGTLVGRPTVALNQDRNIRIRKSLNGRISYSKSNEIFNHTIDFRNYPMGSTYNPDIDLMFTLFDRENPFIIWPCGGRRGSTYFKYQLRGFRLRDAILTQMINDLDPNYYKNIYVGPGNLSCQFSEVI